MGDKWVELGAGVILFLAGYALSGIFNAGRVIERLKAIEETLSEQKTDVLARCVQERKERAAERAENTEKFYAAHERINGLEVTVHEHGERLSAVEAKCRTLHPEKA